MNIQMELSNKQYKPGKWKEDWSGKGDICVTMAGLQGPGSNDCR